MILVDVAAEDAEGNTAEPYSATGMSYEVGSGGAVEGFDEAVSGALADEVRTFEHIPAEGEFADKRLTVSVTVKAVREQELPQADDDFAQLASEFDTIEELEADLRERVRRSGLLELGAAARNAVRDAFLELVDMDVPEGLINDQLEEHFADGHGDDGHRAETEAELRATLKANLVLDKLAEEQDVRVEEAELTQWLISQASRYGMSPDDFAKALVDAGQVQTAIADVRRAKALSVVVDAATITDSEGNTVDLDEIARLLSGEAAIMEAIEEAEAEAEVEVVEEAQEIADEAADAEAQEIADAEAEADAEDESRRGPGDRRRGRGRRGPGDRRRGRG